ncbi:hypothetical protein AAY473_015277 [Plecturocebus cupreus]
MAQHEDGAIPGLAKGNKSDGSVSDLLPIHLISGCLEALAIPNFQVLTSATWTWAIPEMTSLYSHSYSHAAPKQSTHHQKPLETTCMFLANSEEPNPWSMEATCVCYKHSDPLSTRGL